MKRSDPFFSTMRRSKSCIRRIACSRSIVCVSYLTARPARRPIVGVRASRTPLIVARSASYRVLVLGLVLSLFAADDALLHHFLQALIEGLHTLALARLNRRIHLRDFAFADQVSDSGRADHDFVRRNTAAADPFHQRLRNHGPQALGHPGPSPFLFLVR